MSVIGKSIDKSLNFVGSIFRGTGRALDNIGIKIQGKYASIDKLSRHRRLMYMYDQAPTLGRGVFIAPSVSIFGNVALKDRASVWYGAILRGDVSNIEIGNDTCIGDKTVINASSKSLIENTIPTIKIGDRVTIEQNVILQGCTIHHDVIVEKGSTILDGAVVSSHSIVGSGSLVSEGQVIPSGELWEGVPARSVRKLTEEELASISKKNKYWSNNAIKHDEYHELTEQERETERLRVLNKKDNPSYTPDHLY